MFLLWYCTRKSQVTVSNQDNRIQMKPGHKVVPEYHLSCQSGSADKQTNTQTKHVGGDLSSSKACIGFRTAWCYLCNVPHLLPRGLYHWAISGYVSAYVLIDWSLRALDMYSMCKCVCLRGNSLSGLPRSRCDIWPLCGCKVYMNVWSCTANGS